MQKPGDTLQNCKIVTCIKWCKYTWTFLSMGMRTCFMMPQRPPSRCFSRLRGEEKQNKKIVSAEQQQQHGMGRRFPDGGLLRYIKWVPQQLGDVNKRGSGDSRPMWAWHGDTAANHMDLQSGCGRPCVFEVWVWVWSNLWDLIWLRTSNYSMNIIIYSYGMIDN